MAEVSVDHITCQFFDFRWEEGKKSSGERAAYFLWTRICINTFLLLCIFHLLTTSSHPSLLVPSLFLFFFFHLMNISLASPLLFGGRKAFSIALFFFFWLLCFFSCSRDVNSSSCFFLIKSLWCFTNCASEVEWEVLNPLVAIAFFHMPMRAT